MVSWYASGKFHEMEAQRKQNKKTALMIFGTSLTILLTQYLWKELKGYLSRHKWQQEAQAATCRKDARDRARAVFGY